MRASTCEEGWLSRPLAGPAQTVGKFYEDSLLTSLPGCPHSRPTLGWFSTKGVAKGSAYSRQMEVSRILLRFMGQLALQVQMVIRRLAELAHRRWLVQKVVALFPGFLMVRVLAEYHV